MKKRMSTLMSLAVVAAMVAPMAACGSSTASSATSAASSAASTSTAAASSSAAEETSSSSSAAEETTSSSSAASSSSSEAGADEGKVLNIECWNTEFQSRITDHYPDYQKVDDTTGKIGDVTVNWIITPSDDNAYQNNLDSVLPDNESASADDKVDIFLMEADYALKYVNSDVTMSMKDLGIDPDKDFADQYQYTKDIVTDSDGNMKGASWQACSAGLIYNRAIAKEVLGTDDPDEVQKAVADWDTFNETAKKVKDAGYKMTATVNDTYRVYSNNVSAPWVDGTTVKLDDNIKKWVDDSKAMVDAGETGTDELWSDAWSAGFAAPGNVFCYFGPAWLINFSMGAAPDQDDDGSVAHEGGWGMCVGPQSFYWGGTWIAAATGTDNPTLVKDIILTMTTDEGVLKDIAMKDSDCVNNKKVLDELANSDDGNNAILGGQNPYKQLAAGAEKVDMSNISAYDQGLNESFQTAMGDYFTGNSDYDTAYQAFVTSAQEKYPELTFE